MLGDTTDRLISKQMRIAPDRYPVHGDASAIYHALMNLGINAIQSIEEKGPEPTDRVRIEASDYDAADNDPLSLAPGRYVHIVLSDTGVGMPQEVQHRAFDLLYTTKEKGARKGQGLGLAVVYNIVVHHHRGHVEIESCEGEGAAFHLYLPRASAAPKPAQSQPRLLRGGTETILVVEDEPEIVNLTREVLEDLGYTVMTATDGRQGLDLFLAHGDQIALVLLDRTLPRMSGEQVLREMRASDPGVKVVISSGDTAKKLPDFPGALAVLHKPYRLSRLFNTIRDALDHPEDGQRG